MRASDHAPELPGVTELSNRELPNQSLAERIAEVLADQHDWQWREGELSESEMRASRRIRDHRFAATNWLERR